MQQRLAIIVLVLLLASADASFASDEGGADYAGPYAAGARQDRAVGVDVDATATVIELTGTDLIARGARNAADALRLSSDIFVYANDRWPDRNERLASVRGAGPTDVLVLVDGMPVNNGVFGAADLSDIGADQIALIRIYPAPAPVVFGASGAVVEILTKEAGDNFTARFDARFADHRSGYYAAGLGDTHEFFQYFVMADHDGADGFSLPADWDHRRNEDGGIRNNSAYRRDHYRARAGFLLSQQAETHLTFFYDNADREVPVALGAREPEYPLFPETRRMGGMWHARLGAFGPLHVRADAYVSDIGEDREDYAAGDYETVLRRRETRYFRAGGGVTPVLDFGNWSRLSARLETQADDVDYQIHDGVFHERLRVNKHQFSVSDDLRPLSWLQVSLGGGYAVLDPNFALRAEPRDALNGTFYRGGLAVGPFAGVVLRAAGGSNLHLPTTAEWFDPVTGDADLEPAQSTDVEMGARYTPLPGVWFDLAGFYRLVDEAYTLRALDEDDELIADDVAVRTSGLTFSFAATPLPGLMLGGNTSYIDIAADVDGWGEARVLQIPAQRAGGEVRYRFDFGLGATVFGQWVGMRHDFAGGQERELDWYALLNARVFYAYRNHIEVYAQGFNLADVYVENDFNYPEPGRTLEAGLKLTY